MPKKIIRYQNKVIINHLASHYVFGLLSKRVIARIDVLKENNPQLLQQITAWQNQLSLFDRHCEELAPLPETWQKIQHQVSNTKTKKLLNIKRATIIGFMFIALYLLWRLFSL